MDIRATSTYQHYEQEYDFPETDPLFGPSSWTLGLIPEADSKQRRPLKRESDGAASWSDLEGKHTVHSFQAYYSLSPDNKVDKIRARVAFQRDCNIFCFTETWLTPEMLSESVQHPGFFMRRTDRNKHLSGKKSGGVSLMINDSWCNHNNIQELKSFCSPDREFLTIKCRPQYLPREYS